MSPRWLERTGAPFTADVAGRLQRCEFLLTHSPLCTTVAVGRGAAFPNRDFLGAATSATRPNAPDLPCPKHSILDLGVAVVNFVFFSPHFPTNGAEFCDRLKKAGATVLGIGDAPYDALGPKLKT